MIPLYCRDRADGSRLTVSLSSGGVEIRERGATIRLNRDDVVRVYWALAGALDELGLDAAEPAQPGEVEA